MSGFQVLFGFVVLCGVTAVTTADSMDLSTTVSRQRKDTFLEPQRFGTFECFPYRPGYASEVTSPLVIAESTTQTGAPFTHLVDVLSSLWCLETTVLSLQEEAQGTMLMKKGQPRRGHVATICGGAKLKAKHGEALWDSLGVGMYGSRDSSTGTKDCKAWCVFDIRDDNHYFRWDDKKQCYKYKSGRNCKDSDAEERDYADEVRDNICEGSNEVDFVIETFTGFPKDGVPSCMAGSTEVVVADVGATAVDSTFTSAIKNFIQFGADTNTDAGTPTSTRRVEVQNLVVGDMIEGLDEHKQPMWCEVQAIGIFGNGTMSGNYTSNHYVYDADSNSLRSHGLVGNTTYEMKYDVLTSCPLGIDVAGTSFSAIDGDFCGINTTEVAWDDWLALHTAIVNIVQKSGAYWFSSAAYKSQYFNTRKSNAFKDHTARICAEMLKCSTTSDCDELEKVAEEFIKNVLTVDAANTTLVAFPDLGHPDKPGSIASTVKGQQFHTTVTGIVTIVASAVLALVTIIVVVVVVKTKRSISRAMNDKTNKVQPLAVVDV
eukprot:m.219500 g.219500  ORF g.219500 m.219500 type:complete len:544 (+) comp33293_c4_seq9:361-1992(+)